MGLGRGGLKSICEGQERKLDRRKKKIRKAKATAADLDSKKSALSLGSSVFASDSAEEEEYEDDSSGSSSGSSSFNRPKPYLDAANLLKTSP
tara:strand:+ start:787 stop:1062 length:276 start_codon:yes stop_codon:yes gene_type:complete